MGLGRRGTSLGIAVAALLGLVWMAQRLQSAGASVLPAAVAGPIVGPAAGLLLAVAAGWRAAQAQATELTVVALQFGVVALALLTVGAVVVALRPARAERPGAVSILRPVNARPPRGIARQLRCPSCGASVQADWLMCPRCAASLPATQAS